MSELNIIGNARAVSAVSSMIDSGRIPHSIVICGEKGLGKKTLAKYIAAKLLCSGNNKPCGECKSCKMLIHDNHPDFIRVSPSLKSGGYRLEDDLRPIVSDAYIMPNESAYKVYLIADMDKTMPASQNALLKIIEEPPDHTVIILTAASKEYFLPTIISRVITLEMTEISHEDCRNYLKGNTSYNEVEINTAVSAMGGNIGRCLEFFGSKTLGMAISVTKDIAQAIIAKNEYETLKAMWKLDGNKELAVTVWELLIQLCRDAVMIKLGADEHLLGFDKELASKLSSAISSRRLSSLCEVFEKYITRLGTNANLALCLNSISAEIKSTVTI